MANEPCEGSHQEITFNSVKKFKDHTLEQYVSALAQKTPTPGGGSVAALAGACGCALLGMSARYSLGKAKSKIIENRLKDIIRKTGALQKRLLALVDLDAKAYEALVRARRQSKKHQRLAQKKARAVPQEVARLAYEAMESASYLAKYGNKYLISDVAIAIDMLEASYNGALTLVKTNN